MKKLLFLLPFIFISGIVFSQTNTKTTYQQAYIKPSTGTYVQGHYKTVSNNTNRDNFSSTGNTNIYTGTAGTKAKDYSTQATNYCSEKTIYTGSKGGQYYINSNGNKTYVPKQKWMTSYFVDGILTKSWTETPKASLIL